MKIEHETRFDFGDLVVLAAHVKLPQEGRPQIGCVVAVRYDIDAESATLIYYIRWLCEARMTWTCRRQTSAGTPDTSTNLYLVSEGELLLYDPVMDVTADKAMKANP